MIVIGEHPAELDVPSPFRRAVGALGRHRALLVIVAVGFVSRLVWVLMVDSPGPGGEIAMGDQHWYYHYAREMAEGHGYANATTGQPTAYYPVGYPALLAALFWFVAHTPLPDDYVLAAQLVNVLVSTATIVFAFVLARRIFDPLAGLIAAGVLAVFPNLVFQMGSLQLETMYIFWCFAALCALVTHDWTRGPPPTRRLLVFGVLLGVSVLVRPFSILFVVGVLVAAHVAGFGWRKAALAAAIPLGVVVVISVPWTIRNAISLDAFVPTSTNIGDTLCLDRVDGATGGFQWAEHEGCADPTLPEVERNSISTGKAIRFVLGDPVRELIQIGRRGRLIFATDHDGIEASSLVGQGEVVSPSTARTLRDVADAYFHVVTAMALAGLALALGRRPRRPESVLVLVSLAALVAVPLLLWGNPRFHLPFSPLLAVLAGGAAAAAVDRRRYSRPTSPA